MSYKNILTQAFCMSFFLTCNITCLNESLPTHNEAPTVAFAVVGLQVIISRNSPAYYEATGGYILAKPRVDLDANGNVTYGPVHDPENQVTILTQYSPEEAATYKLLHNANKAVSENDVLSSALIDIIRKK